MKRLLWRLGLALAVVVALPAQASTCNSLDGIRWLLGDWTAENSETLFHESWTEAAARTFEGSGVERAKADGAVKGKEALRLVEMAGEVFYVSKVSHNELAIAFRLAECADDRFVFVNAAHDFPRRIEYRLIADDRFDARVSDGADKGFTLEYHRAAAPADAGAAVLAAEDARFSAMIAADADAMTRLLAEDLEYTHSSGKVDDRRQLIDSIMSGARRYRAVAPGERKVLALGADHALVRGQGRFQVSEGESPLDLQIRYLAVYTRDGGNWRLRAWQSLRIP